MSFIITGATRPKAVAIQAVRLTTDQIRERANNRYPGYSITYLWESKRPDQATEIWLENGSRKVQRLFDPYTGADIGRSVPIGIGIIAWCSNLHTNLLAGPTGRAVNGVASMLVTLLCLTGAILWWPGIAKWRRSLMVDPRANWKRLNWELHSVVGFWTFALVFMWAFTGIYLVFPDPFQQAVNHVLPLDFYKPLTDNRSQRSRKHPNPVFVLAGRAADLSSGASRPLQQRQTPPVHPALFERRHGAALGLLSALRQFRGQQDQGAMGRVGTAAGAAVPDRRAYVVEPRIEPRGAAAADVAGFRPRLAS